MKDIAVLSEKINSSRDICRKERKTNEKNKRDAIGMAALKECSDSGLGADDGNIRERFLHRQPCVKRSKGDGRKRQYQKDAECFQRNHRQCGKE